MDQKLSVSPFEHYMWTDDRVDYPMCFFMRFVLLGSVDGERLAESVREAAQRHPLLNCIMVGDTNDRTQKLAWQRTTTPLKVERLKLTHGDSPIVVPRAEFLDITKEVGLRVHLLEGSERTCIHIQCHHATADAMAILQFFEDLFLIYLNMRAQLRPPRFADCGVRGLFRETRRSLWKRVYRDYSHTGRFFMFRPSQLGDSKCCQHANFPALATQTVEEAGLAAYASAATKVGATVNDLLLADLFYTLNEWSLKHRKGRNVRIAVPINMRTRDDGVPMSNFMSMLFINRRRPRNKISNARLTQSIVREMRYIKKFNMGVAFVRALNRLGSVPKLMRFATTSGWPYKCYSTSVLSNLGLVDRESILPRNADGRFGDDQTAVERIELFPPIRPNTHTSFGVGTYNREMSISLNYDPIHVAKSDAESLLAKFRTRILSHGMPTLSNAQSQTTLLQTTI